MPDAVAAAWAADPGTCVVVLHPEAPQVEECRRLEQLYKAQLAAGMAPQVGGWAP